MKRQWYNSRALSLPQTRAIRWIFMILFLILLQASLSLSWSTTSIIFTANHGETRRLKQQQFTRCQMAGVAGVESTPNPSSFLIRLSSPLEGLEDMSGSLRGKKYSSPSSTDAPEDVASILQIDGIESVYAMATILTINKKSSSKWETILPLVMKSLLGNDDGVIEAQEKLLQGLMSVTAATTMPSATKTAGQQVLMRIQMSNKIPIQIEGTGYFGTVQRMKLPPKFQEYMELMQNGGIDFFAGRKWIDRGIRYLSEDDGDLNGVFDIDTNVRTTNYSIEEKERLHLQSILQAEVEEVDAAYPSQRLARIVSESLGENHQGPDEHTTNVMQDEEEGIVLPQLDLEAVDKYCDLAELGDLQALKVLANFVSSNQGLLPARRNAIAFLGGTGDNAGTMNGLVFDAIVAALQNEKSPMMRRTAGDALSDLGNKLAVPYAASALEVDRSKLVQWRAARILGELADSSDIVAVLKQASFSSKYAFEVAFEIKDALRKVQARVQARNGDENYTAPKSGPIWKQIQEGASSIATEEDIK